MSCYMFRCMLVCVGGGVCVSIECNILNVPLMRLIHETQ